MDESYCCIRSSNVNDDVIKKTIHHIQKLFFVERIEDTIPYMKL